MLRSLCSLYVVGISVAVVVVDIVGSEKDLRVPGGRCGKLSAAAAVDIALVPSVRSSDGGRRWLK
jgi:hypothetical protein